MNAAQECNDNCLDYFTITRDMAETIPMISSGIVGINFLDAKGFNFILQWRNAMLRGVFNGSRKRADISNSRKSHTFLEHCFPF